MRRYWNGERDNRKRQSLSMIYRVGGDSLFLGIIVENSGKFHEETGLTNVVKVELFSYK